jgi:hypothetical protein
MNSKIIFAVQLAQFAFAVTDNFATQLTAIYPQDFPAG